MLSPRVRVAQCAERRDEETGRDIAIRAIGSTLADTLAVGVRLAPPCGERPANAVRRVRGAAYAATLTRAASLRDLSHFVGEVYGSRDATIVAASTHQGDGLASALPRAQRIDISGDNLRRLRIFPRLVVQRTPRGAPGATERARKNDCASRAAHKSLFLAFSAALCAPLGSSARGQASAFSVLKSRLLPCMWAPIAPRRARGFAPCYHPSENHRRLR
jgi:hypothetical protein